jgi:hypothetical protein
MIEKVTIYGDSFADPQWDNVHPTWYGLLKDEGYKVTNLGKSGSGPMYSFKHLYRNISKYNNDDLLVVIISGAPRLDVEEKDYRLVFEMFKDETIYGNWKYESLLYALSRQQCKVFAYFLSVEESYFKTSLNDDRYFCFSKGLADVSWDEYVEEERSRDATDDQYYRANHLSADNHIIMYQQIVNFINGKPIPSFLEGIYRGTYNKDEFIYD